MTSFITPQKLLKIAPSIVLCGMDEVGRGPWAGPVVACALIMKVDFRIKGLNDSKKMTARKREQIAPIIRKKSYYGIGQASAQEVDKWGLIPATNKAFERALTSLFQSHPTAPQPGILLIDGRDKFVFAMPHKSIIKGDQKLKIIAAASVLAKVERDTIMRQQAKKYPHYGFETHVGYGTKRHHQALKKHGPCPLHRQSFAPVAALGR